jgi:hypothetical protein
MSSSFSGSETDIQVGDMRVLHCALGATTGAITGISKASPAVVTDVSHGLASGDRVRITGVVGMVELNGRDFLVNVLTADTFQLVGENSTDHTTYVSDGLWTKYTVTDLGYTAPGSSLTLGRTWRDRTADQSGTTPIDQRLTGESAQGSLTLLQVTPVNLARIYKPSTLTGAAAGYRRAEGGGSLAGRSAYGDAFLLVLHPLDVADTSVIGEWRLYKAHFSELGANPMDHQQDQQLAATIVGLPDRDRARGVRTWGYFQ